MRRLAHEAAHAGLLSPELAAGISRVRGVKQLRSGPSGGGAEFGSTQPWLWRQCARKARLCDVGHAVWLWLEGRKWSAWNAFVRSPEFPVAGLKDLRHANGLQRSVIRYADVLRVVTVIFIAQPE